MLNEKFLESYRTLEQELKSDGMSVLDYEQSHDDTLVQERLKLCRIVRNYLVHNDKDFFTCTKQMVNFIDDVTSEIVKKKKLVCDCMKRKKPVHPGAKIKDMIPVCAKGAVPVTDEKTGKFLFLADSDYLVKQMAKKNTKVEKPKKTSAYNFVSKTDKMEGLCSGIYIVTSDGSAKGKYLGVLEI